MTDIKKIQKHVLKMLESGLPPYLSYHNVAHTLDVLRQAMIIADEESVAAPGDLFLLQVSALYHDVGFLYAYEGHEEKGCEVAKRELGDFGLSAVQIDSICNMIRATRIPQSPQTVLETILCDADLDYLGRPDFYTIGEGLYREFLHQGVVRNEVEWNRLQVRFLESHHYFTKTCKKKRDESKQLHLQEIKKKVAVAG